MIFRPRCAVGAFKGAGLSRAPFGVSRSRRRRRGAKPLIGGGPFGGAEPPMFFIRFQNIIYVTRFPIRYLSLYLFIYIVLSSGVDFFQ